MASGLRPRVAASAIRSRSNVVGFCHLRQNGDGFPCKLRRHSRCTACGMPMQTADSLNQITSFILSAAIDIHRALGPGLLESAYLTCLTRDLADARVRIELQRAVPLVYKGIRIECAYRADLVVEESVVVEVKAIETLTPIHDQQLNTYLRLGDYRVGLLLNFNAPTMKAGIKRIVNRFPEK